jgi:hypothetical protein
VSVSFNERRGYVAKSACRAPGRSRVLLRGGGPSLAGRKNPMSESQSRSRLELARDEVDRVFGEGYAAAHPQMVLAVMNVAATDWAARSIVRP